MGSTISRRGLDPNNIIGVIVSGLEDTVRAMNPHLNGRFITVLNSDDASDSFKIMKRIKCTVSYHSNKTGKNTECIVLQEVMRMPNSEIDAVMWEFSRRFMAAVFMFTSSNLYKDLIDGKLDCEPPTDFA